MSRTVKGNKGPGYEYWGRRPMNGCSPGKEIKKICHKLERKRAKADLQKGILLPKHEAF